MALIRSNKKGSGGGGTTILKGTNQPLNAQGSNGQIYLQHLSIPSGVDIRASISNSANGDYFDTGYKVKENTRIETKFNVSGGETYPTPFGARYDKSGGNVNQCFFALQNANIYYAFGCAEVRTDNAFAYNTDTLVIAEKSGLKMYSGNNLKYISTNAFSQANTYNLFLFCANLAGSPWTASWAVMTLYYCKIYEGDDLVHYFLPCVDSNSEPCLYDVITGDYLYNQGSGTLTVGSAITLDDEIVNSYAKVSGTWQGLLGTDIDNITDATESAIVYKNYIKFNGAGIVLPWSISSDHKVEVVFNETTYNNDTAIIGNTLGPSFVHLTEYSNKYYCSRGEGESNFGTWSSGEHTFVCNNGNSHNEFDNAEVTEYTPTTAAHHYTLGCRGDSVNRNAYYGYIKSFKIYSISTGNLLHHLRPCMVLNQAFFVDDVEGKLFTNDSINAVDTIS